MSRTSRILLVGANGWLGQAIHDLLPEAIPVPPHAFLAGDRGVLAGPLNAQDVIINAAGSKTPATLQEANVELVAQLIELAAPSRARIVHLASAAEYGIGTSATPLVESGPEQPSSEYGRTKLAATNLLRHTDNSCVLRLFNIVALPPQPGSPLADIVGRVAAGIENGHGPEVLAAETYRDWVSRDFVVESVVAAVRQGPVGVFNICSGIPVSMGGIVRALLARQGSSLPVMDLHQAPASFVVGDPTAWERATGLSERMDADAIAGVLVPQQEVTA